MLICKITDKRGLTVGKTKNRKSQNNVEKYSNTECGQNEDRECCKKMTKKEEKCKMVVCFFLKASRYGDSDITSLSLFVTYVTTTTISHRITLYGKLFLFFFPPSTPPATISPPLKLLFLYISLEHQRFFQVQYTRQFEEIGGERENRCN